jgi:ABC-2 type transport system ATP-binding protein
MVAEAEPLVEARALTKRYGDFVAVDTLSFHVDRGEIYGLLGPNGAGKTTTILMLLGLSEPSSGEARVLGLDPARDPLEVKRWVGYMPDSVGFYGRLSGRENLEYTARLSGVADDVAAQRIEDLLGQVRLTDAADQAADTYSRGMLQRLGVADALVKDPSVLILDEPTASIDPAGVADLLDLIRGLVANRGLAVLLSSHLLAQVEQLCDRVGIFSRGRLIAEGTVAELAERAGDPKLALDEVYRRLAAETARDGRAA